MPDRAVVEAFAARVEAGDYVGAIEDYYAPDAFMQENAGPPRQGRDRLVAHERKVMAAYTVKAARLGPILIEGDEVAIRWRFELTDAQGRTRAFEEVAWQLWQDDRVVEERFYYDPGQMAG